NRTDYLIVEGTAASDIFDVTAGQVALKAQATGGTPREVLIPVSTPGASFLELQGLEGDDTFNLSGSLPYANGVLADGGDPSASLVGNPSRATGAVTASLADSTTPTPTTVQGYGGLVTLIGDEVVNLDTNNNTLTVNGTSQPDALTYTPTGATAGTLQNAGL